MNRVLYIIVVALLLSTAMQAHTENKSLFLQTEKNIGTITHREKPAVVNFELVNTTDVPVVIYKVKKSCGCLDVNYDKRPVPPKGKRRIMVSVDVALKEGRFHKSLMVYMSGHKPSILKIKGTII